MIEIIIWLAAFLCPNPNHTVENHGNCNLIHVNTVSSSSNEEGSSGDIDTGGETGGTPRPPVLPPPPHSSGN